MAKTIIFDRVAGNFIITSQTDYSVLTDIDLSVPIDGGVEIFIDGSLFYGNSSITSVDYNVNANTNETTMVATIPLPKDSEGNIVVGEYEINTFDRYTLNAGGTSIYAGDSNIFTYLGQVDKSACITDSYSCVAPSITLYDSTDYDSGDVVPTVESAELKLTYPDSSEIAPITATSLPLQIDTSTVYTKDYRINEDITLLYDFTTYQERIRVLAEGGFDVKCDTLCSVSKCINSFKQEMDKAKGYNDTKYQKMLSDYNKIMSISTQVMIENSCDGRDNIPALLNEITDIINASSCKTNCDGSCNINGVSERVYGLGNAVSGDSLLNTNNGIVFSPQTSEIYFNPDGLDFTTDGAGRVTVKSQVKPSDIVSQSYIDNQDNLRVLKSGDTMTGTLNGTNVDLSGSIQASDSEITNKALFGSTSNANGMSVNIIPSGSAKFARVSFSDAGDESTKSYVGVNTFNSNNLQLGIADDAWLELNQSNQSVDVNKDLNVNGVVSGTSAEFSSIQTDNNIILDLDGQADFTGIYLKGDTGTNAAQLRKNQKGAIFQLKDDSGVEKFKFENGITTLGGNLSGTSAEFSNNLTVNGSSLFKGNLRFQNNGSFPQITFRVAPSDDKNLTRAGDSLSWDGNPLITELGGTFTGSISGTSANFTGTIDASVIQVSSQSVSPQFVLKSTSVFRLAEINGSNIDIGDVSVQRLNFISELTPTYGNREIQLKQGGLSADVPIDPSDFEQYFATDLNGGKGYLLTWDGFVWRDPFGATI